MDVNDIKNLYNAAIDKYVSKFKDMYFHDVPCEGFWVANEPGGVYFINDYYLAFNTIKYAVDNNVGEAEFFDWYDNTMLHVQDWSNRNAPTLKDWWDNRENQERMLDWELDTYRRKILEFPGELGFVQAYDPTEKGGWYAVILCGENGIVQDAWQWEGGKWLHPEYEEPVLVLARSYKPLEINHSQKQNVAKTD